MSWLSQMAGGETPEPYRESISEKKVKDPSVPNRMVSNKTANRPFLAYQEYREQQEALHTAWAERQKEREAKVARGEKVGPPEPDPTAQKEVGFIGLLKIIFFLLLTLALAGKFITGSYTWEYDAKWLQVKKLFQPTTNQRLFSERWLAEFDGRVPGRPIYLAIDGDVYDVTMGAAYQPGGSYAILAGVDAARAFGTGCFQTHRTHDTREMSEKELRSLAHWKKFYAEHKEYFKVGRVSHPPIDPKSPVPVHCDPKKQAAAVKAREARNKVKPVVEHQEL